VAWVAGKGWELQDGDGGYVAPEVLAMDDQVFHAPSARLIGQLSELNSPYIKSV